MTTYTEDELKAQVAKAVADATAPLEAKLVELQAADQESATAAAIAQAVADATAPFEAQVAELQAKLDTAEAARKQAEDGLAERLQADADREAKEKLDAAKAERLEAVADTKLFTAEYMAENADRWASLTDEAWDAQIAEYRSLKDRAGEQPTPPPPGAAGPMAAAAEGDETDNPVRRVLQQRVAGVDLTKIH